jgi:hypothetical protein
MTARHHQRIKLGCNVALIVHAEVACEDITNATLSWLVPNGFVTQVTLIQIWRKGRWAARLRED